MEDAIKANQTWPGSPRSPWRSLLPPAITICWVLCALGWGGQCVAATLAQALRARTLVHVKGYNLWSICSLPDGSLAFPSMDKANIYDLKKRRIISSLRVASPAKLGAVGIATSPDGRSLAVGACGQIALFDLKTRRRLWNYRTMFLIDKVVFSHNGRKILFFTDERKRLGLLNAANGRKLQTWTQPTTKRHAGPAFVAFSGARGDIISASMDGFFYRWRVGRARPIGKTWLGINVRSGAISPDGKRIVFGSEHGRVVCCRVRSMKVLWRSRVGAWVHAVAFSKNGKEVAVAAGWGGGFTKRKMGLAEQANRISLLPVNNGRILARTPPLKWSPLACLFMKGTSRIVFTTIGGDVCEITVPHRVH